MTKTDRVVYFKVTVTDKSGIYLRGYTDNPKLWTKTDLEEGWYQVGQPPYTVNFEVIVRQ